MVVVHNTHSDDHLGGRFILDFVVGIELRELSWLRRKLIVSIPDSPLCLPLFSMAPLNVDCF